MQQASDNPDLFPSFELFASMPAVQVFWKEEDSLIDEERWDAAANDISEQLPKVYRWIKLELARSLLKAYGAAGHPLPDDIRLSIHPREPQTDDSLSPWEIGYTHHTALDIDDPSTISSLDLDALLSRFTATFRTYNSSKPLSWEEFCKVSKPHFIQERDFVPKIWLQTQLEILKQTELEDNSETYQKLQQLGPKFSCDKCHDNLNDPFYFLWIIRHRPVTKPEKSRGLTWEEMVRLSSSIKLPFPR